jgi:hypothetical protein
LDLGGPEAFEFHPDTNLLELPFGMYHKFQDMARGSYGVEEALMEEGEGIARGIGERGTASLSVGLPHTSRLIW